MNSLIQQFLNHLKNEKSRTQETINNYYFYLDRFLNWSKIKSPEEITVTLTKKYRLWLAKQMSGRYLLDKSTQNYYLIALRSFVRYLNEINKCNFDPKNIFLEKTERKNINHLDLEEIESLMRTPLNTQESHIVQLRDRAILELLFCAGLKVSELAALKKTDINLNQDEFLIQGKFGRPRACLLSNQAKFALKNYLNFRRDKIPYLFIRHDHAKNLNESGHLTPRSLQRAISYYGKLAGIKKKVTPQTLRHTFTYLMFNEGAELEQVQKLLGHTSLNSTHRYQRLNN